MEHQFNDRTIKLQTLAILLQRHQKHIKITSLEGLPGPQHQPLVPGNIWPQAFDWWTASRWLVDATRSLIIFFLLLHFEMVEIGSQNIYTTSVLRGRTRDPPDPLFM